MTTNKKLGRKLFDYGFYFVAYKKKKKKIPEKNTDMWQIIVVFVEHAKKLQYKL